MVLSEKLKKQAKRLKIRTTYDKNGKRLPRKDSAIKNEINKKKNKFGVVKRQSDGHFREEHPASGLKVNPNDNTKWIWLPVKWNYCKTCGLYHSNRTIPVSFWKRKWEAPSSNVKAGVIIVRGDELLMTQSYNDKFGFPKGGVDNGENIKQAASRELYEETGIYVNPSNLKSSLRVVSGRNIFHMFVYNVSQYFRIRSVPLDDTEITTFGWVKIDKVSSLKLSNATKAVLYSYKKTGVDSNNWRRR